MIQARQLIVFILIIAFIAFATPYIDIIEGAATSPATLMQLSASSTTPFTYPQLRPVRQRGMYFYAPSWTR